jgi:uncharacterized protein (DUF305 family)
VAELPRAKELIHDLCDFRVRVNEIPSDVSELDQHFIEAAIAGNMLEIQSLEIARDNTTNEEWRGLINAMIIMHTSDLEMAVQVAEKIGADTDSDLTNARVYPETPAYDLGTRVIDLEARFLAPLMNAAGPTGTGTVAPTETGTILPTETGTPAPTETATATQIATGLPTELSTITVTSSPNAFTGRFVNLLQTNVPTDTSTATQTATALPTNTATETATALPTNTAIATQTATAFPTDTATATETATTLPTNTATATQTAIVLPTNTATATATATAIGTNTATSSPTVVPTDITPGPVPGVNFDLLAIDIITDEHAMSIETALVAQRLVENDEIRAFAKHAADMAHFHMMLMDDLQYRLVHNITLPLPRFHEDYQSPRRLEPN